MMFQGKVGNWNYWELGREVGLLSRYIQDYTQLDVYLVD